MNIIEEISKTLTSFVHRHATRVPGSIAIPMDRAAELRDQMSNLYGDPYQTENSKLSDAEWLKTLDGAASIYGMTIRVVDITLHGQSFK